MSEIINSEITIAKDQIKSMHHLSLSDDRAFSHVLLKYFYDVNYIDQIDLVTDGANDGGIDFLTYDEEENKVILCQAKYTGALSFEQIITELDKMYSTVENFKRSLTGSYNDKIKKALQNALDRLPDDSSENIEYALFTTAPLDTNAAKRKIETTQHNFPIDAVTIYTVDDIEKTIMSAHEALSTVSSEKIKIDKPNNFLEYESDDLSGIFCNVLSSSIIQLYNKYSGKGLFDLNIRRYIRNKLVDTGINNTLDKDRENFWFLNNGIIIACSDFYLDGDTIRLENFSIVNGGQTTQLIGTYKGTNTKEFYIPCKIVSSKNERNTDFYTKIAEATNSQKPIYPRDLRSNSPEMVRLSRWLGQEGIYLEIKRGMKPPRNCNYTIKNDEFGQIIMSFALQQPGTSRNGKRKIFEAGNYERIFKVNYEKDQAKKAFLKDLINLNDRYIHIEEKFKTRGLSPQQLEILNNGKQILFALMGVFYRLTNRDITENDLLISPKSVSTIPFVYDSFISKYSGDDLEVKLEHVVKDSVIILNDIYQKAFNNLQTSSVSNFFKSDSKYYTEILPNFTGYFSFMAGEDLKNCIDIFKR